MRPCAITAVLHLALTALAVLLALVPASALRELSLRQVITRNVSAVRLDEGDNLMEVVDEETCSATLVRLTCRSFNSFVFVLKAQYQPNRTSACVYDRKSWCKLKAHLAKVRHLQRNRHFLQSQYETELPDEDPYDFRSSLNRR